MENRLLIGKKPHYYRGQLLLEDDFIAEQDYHAGARRRHTLNLHGWGVVRGLEVAVAGERALSIGPGFAVDGNGHEIEVRDAAGLDLSGGEPGAVLSIALVYMDEPATDDNAEQRSRDRYAVLRASTGIAEGAVLLAMVTLDAGGKLVPGSIDTGRRRELPGLLRLGWARMPFRPIGLLPDKTKPNSKPPPAFLVGATRAQAEEAGAGGTMAISLPPQASRIHRFRIAGEHNAKGMIVRLWIGGWNPVLHQHAKRAALDQRIEAQTPFDLSFDIGPADGAVDPENSTLSLEIRSDGSCTVSLVAVEFSWRPQRPW